MAIPNPVSPNKSAPIIRSTASTRVAEFNAQSNSIYNKFSVYNQSGASREPYLYTKISDPSRNDIRYDTQALPVYSTIYDLKRVTKFSTSGKGGLFVAKQFIIQNQNAFNETRIYNPLSILSAAAGISRPLRHIDSGGGLLNFFASALLSTVGIQSLPRTPIEGTATGPGGNVNGSNLGPFSMYAALSGGARAGVIRYNTADKAIARFSNIFPISNQSNGTSGGGILAGIGRAIINTVRSAIPSTNPLGIFGGSPENQWTYRPEYPKGKIGAYDRFLTSAVLATKGKTTIEFYNGVSERDGIDPTSEYFSPGYYHRYKPSGNAENEQYSYTTHNKIVAENNIDGLDGIGTKLINGENTNLKSVYQRYFENLEAVFTNFPIQERQSVERYASVKYKNPTGQEKEYPNYGKIPGQNNDLYGDYYQTKSNGTEKRFLLDVRGFYKVSGSSVSSYNELSVIGGTRDNIPNDLTLNSSVESRDLIFFYFFDLVNQKYIPFRATITSLSDQHSTEWEDVQYMGRADKLFVYRGFSRDVSFGFTVYADSATELKPMWERINYLVGMTRPSKYTEGENLRESNFIYPPMLTLRLGDMYYDQPCVLNGVGITIPDDATWELNRSNENGLRQLPRKVDVNVTLKMLEKKLSIVSDDHFGYTSPLAPEGTSTTA
jgi:hypothetical protein